jgi:hypothetical protein
MCSWVLLVIISSHSRCVPGYSQSFALVDLFLTRYNICAYDALWSKWFFPCHTASIDRILALLSYVPAMFVSFVCSGSRCLALHPKGSRVAVRRQRKESSFSMVSPN